MQPPSSILPRRRRTAEQLFDEEIADRVQWVGPRGSSAPRASLALMEERRPRIRMDTVTAPRNDGSHQHEQTMVSAPDWHTPSSQHCVQPLRLPLAVETRGSVQTHAVVSPPCDTAVLPAMSTILQRRWTTSPQWQPIDSTQRMCAPSIVQGANNRLASATSPINTQQFEWSPGRSPVAIKRERSPSEELPHAELDTVIDDCSSPRSCSTSSGIAENQQDNSSGDVPEGSERKSSRYLREMDRRAILERLARGEKQATLAKEYYVSRAAICNLYKHRHEVMSRTDEDPFAKHPKKRKNKKTLKCKRSRSLKLAAASSASAKGVVRAVVTPPVAPSRVHLVQTDAVLLLLTTMSDNRSSAEEFRRANERVLWLLIEESMAVVPIHASQFNTGGGATLMGVATEHPPCAISMEQTRSPMLEVFQLLEPERPFGCIRCSHGELVLDDARLPATLKYHNVFLFEIAIISSDAVCAMIELVKRRGALEVMIYIVALFISADAAATLQREYPHVRIVTTQIESHVLEREKARRSCVDVVLGRFDHVYQTQYTMV